MTDEIFDALWCGFDEDITMVLTAVDYAHRKGDTEIVNLLNKLLTLKGSK